MQQQHLRPPTPSNRTWLAVYDGHWRRGFCLGDVTKVWEDLCFAAPIRPYTG